MRAPANRGPDPRNVLLGKDAGKSRALSTGSGANFAAALKLSLEQHRAEKGADASLAGSVAQGEGDTGAALEKAVPGRARERRSSERRRDGTEHDMAQAVVTLPFERLRVRGLGMEAIGAATVGRQSPMTNEPETTRTTSTRVIAGHVLGLTVTGDSAGREPTTAVQAKTREAGEASESEPQRRPAENGASPRAPEFRVDGPSMAPARSAASEAVVPVVRQLQGDPSARDAASVALESRSAVGAGAVLERSDAIASARQELVQGASARPVPQRPTVEALPVGLGGALPVGLGGALPVGLGGALPVGLGGALAVAAQREAGRGQGARDGSREGDTEDPDDRARPVEASPTGSASAFVAPAREAGASSSTTPAPAGSTPEASSTPERVADVIEQLDVRSVEAGRNTSPLKVNLGELGEVRVSMTRDDGLAVRLDTSDPRAAVAFETGRRELELALESHGLRELRVAVEGATRNASPLAPERPATERVQLGALGAETHGRQDDRDGQMGQDRSGRQGSDGRENGAHDEREHREAIHAAIERRERERRFAPTHGPASAGRRLGSA